MQCDCHMHSDLLVLADTAGVSVFGLNDDVKVAAVVVAAVLITVVLVFSVMTAGLFLL